MPHLQNKNEKDDRRRRLLGLKAAAQQDAAPLKISSAQLSQLLHGEFVAEQRQRRLLQQQAAPGPAPSLPSGPPVPPLMGRPPPPPPPAADVLLNLTQLGGLDGGSVYVVTTTGVPANDTTGLAVAGKLSPEQLSNQVQGIVAQLEATMNSGSNGLSSLWNTLFWITIAMVGCLVVHAVLRGLLIWRRKRIPQFLEVRPCAARAPHALALLRAPTPCLPPTPHAEPAPPASPCSGRAWSSGRCGVFSPS